RGRGNRVGGAVDQAGKTQVRPEGARLLSVCRGVVGSFDLAVAIALAEGNRGPARGGAVVVAGQALVAILIGIDGDRNTIHVVDHILDLGLGDQLLALQYAAKQQADNDQNDGDFDQGETALLLSHGDPPRLDAAVLDRKS